MMSQWFRSKQYTILPTRSEDIVADNDVLKREQNLDQKPPRTTTVRFSILALIISLALLSGLVGFGIAFTVFRDVNNAAQSSDTVPQVPLGHATKTFRFNQNFANPPTRGAPEPVWDSLIPAGLGYVKDTPLSGPDISVISSFHQLHCLYTLRRAYSSETEGGEDFDFGLDRGNHTTHCFEYLRQSIICSADSALEPTENASSGFLGWGFPRECRDYDALKDWAEKWRAFDMSGFLAHPSADDEKSHISGA